jgi:electron transport complex protein RnfG
MATKQKIASTFPNMVIVLTAVALISALALSFTNLMTLEARQLVEVKRTIRALKDVLPEFDNDPNSEKFKVDGFDELEFFPAKKEDRPVGTAIKTFSDDAFSERIWLMVGFDSENKIYRISVLKQRETPGLGTKMKEAKFKKQFDHKDPVSFKIKVKKDGGDVDAITAATISSRAFCDAVNRAYRALLRGGER